MMTRIKKMMSICVVLLFVGAGCSEKDSASLGEMRFAISAAETMSNVFSFEDNTLLWTSSASIDLSSNASDGLQSLAITSCGWLEVNSPVFATSQISAVDDAVRFDLFIPQNQSNPWWIGDVGFLLSVPSAGIYHQWFGQQLLNELERGSWVEAEVALPNGIKTVLEGEYADVTLHLIVNTSSCAEPILIDNIRFAETTKPQECSANGDCGIDEYCLFTECGATTGIGVCEAMPNACTTDLVPVCGCDDQTYDNGCEAAASGVSVAQDGECVSTVVCADTSDCPVGDYCQKDSCEDELGVCADKTWGCEETVDQEVCGCNGSTFTNECFAAKYGVNINYEGACVSDSCADNSDCPVGDYCQKDSCEDELGVCADKTWGCEETVDQEVCGCNGSTFTNECFAAKYGVNINYEGACVSDSCADNSDCPVGDYCQKDSCEDELGVCADKTWGCEETVEQEVCGCNGSTYTNECFAAKFGVNINYSGVCQTE